MEAQVLMGQEAGAADAAQVGPQKRFGRLVIIPARRVLGTDLAGLGPAGCLPDPQPCSTYLRYFLPRKRLEGRPRRRGGVSGSSWQVGAVFSTSDWLTLGSTGTLLALPRATRRPGPEELGASGSCGSGGLCPLWELTRGSPSTPATDMPGHKSATTHQDRCNRSQSKYFPHVVTVQSLMGMSGQSTDADSPR